LLLAAVLATVSVAAQNVIRVPPAAERAAEEAATEDQPVIAEPVIAEPEAEPAEHAPDPSANYPTRDWAKIYIGTWQILQFDRVYNQDGVEAWNIGYKSLEEKITGFIARPRIRINPSTGKPAVRYPAIILCHDGPWGVSRPYRDFAIEMAKRGYVVAASSYRGNRGLEGQSQGTREFGKREVIDVLQLAQLIRKEEYVDSLRMAIVGQGEGGLIAAQAIGRSNIFRAAVLMSPYLFSASPQHGYAGIQRFANVTGRTFGRRWSEGELVRGMHDRDAFRFAHKISTPTLIITPSGFAGADEVARWTAVLNRNNVQHTVLRYPGVSENFFWTAGAPFTSGGEARAGAWENITRWITAHAPPN